MPEEVVVVLVEKVDRSDLKKCLFKKILRMPK
jgi:hypothetical protein